MVLHVSFPLGFIWRLAQTFGNYSDIKLMTHLIWSKSESQQRERSHPNSRGSLSKNMDSASLMSIYHMCLQYPGTLKRLGKRGRTKEGQLPSYSKMKHFLRWWFDGQRSFYANSAKDWKTLKIRLYFKYLNKRLKSREKMPKHIRHQWRAIGTFHEFWQQQPLKEGVPVALF